MPRKYIKTGKPAVKPLIIQTPEEMKEKVDAYFNNCPDTKKYVTSKGTSITVTIPTLTGLILHLGFAKKSTFYDYGKKKEFKDVVDYARTLIEREYEKSLQLPNCTGSIFALKNFGWKDEHDVNVNKVRNKEEIEAELSILIGKALA